MIRLIISIFILLLALFLLLCRYYIIEDDINKLPNSFVFRYFYRLISYSKILSNIHPIVYLIISNIAFIISVIFILVLIF